MDAFELTAVVHLVRPAGRTARNLDELRSSLAQVHERALFFHTVQSLLRAPDEDDPPADDLSAWVNGVVQDSETAERLAYAVQSQGGGPDALRQALLQVLDELPERTRITRDAPEGGEFVFLAADSVPVPTGWVASRPEELYDLLARAEASVWFYHMIEQPWFAAGERPLTIWLREAGARRLADGIDETSTQALPLPALRRRVLGRLRRSELGRRLAEAVQQPEEERREAGRAAVAGLVRRLRQGGEEP